MDSRVGACSGPLPGEIFFRQFEHCRIEFNVVHPLKTGMLQRLQQASAGPTSDKKKTFRGRVLEQRKVHGLLRRGGVWRIEHQQPILKQAADSSGFNDRKIAVHGITSIEHAKTRPEASERDGLQTVPLRQTGSYKGDGQKHNRSNPIRPFVQG